MAVSMTVEIWIDISSHFAFAFYCGRSAFWAKPGPLERGSGHLVELMHRFLHPLWLGVYHLDYIPGTGMFRANERPLLAGTRDRCRMMLVHVLERNEC